MMPTPTEKHPMAKKLAFPNRPCPKCGSPIHIKTKTHECGWSLDGKASAAPSVKRGGKRKKRRAKVAAAATNASITMQDIEAVKSVVDRLGADKVRQLAEVLAK
jgi:hypothetical protein